MSPSDELPERAIVALGAPFSKYARPSKPKNIPSAVKAANGFPSASRPKPVSARTAQPTFSSWVKKRLFAFIEIRLAGSLYSWRAAEPMNGKPIPADLPPPDCSLASPPNSVSGQGTCTFMFL